MSNINPDQIALHRFMTGERKTMWDSNPMATALGMQIAGIDTGKGLVELSFQPDTLFVQGAGVLQGGSVTAMLDFAMSFCVLASLPAGQSCATCNINVSFLRAAAHGAYTAVGQIERMGKRLAFTNAKLWSTASPDQMIATATSTLSII